MSDWGNAIDDIGGEGGSGTSAGSIATMESVFGADRVLRRGPCRKACALLRPRNDDGCEKRLVGISGSDLDGDLGDIGIGEESVFSSCMLLWRFETVGGAERIMATEVDARTSNWREIYASEFMVYESGMISENRSGTSENRCQASAILHHCLNSQLDTQTYVTQGSRSIDEQC